MRLRILLALAVLACAVPARAQHQLIPAIGLRLDSQTVTPCISGQACIWRNGNTLNFTKTDGTTISLGAGGGSTGNWTFSGNNADLTGAGTMGLGTSVATSLRLFPTTLTLTANSTLGMATQAATNTTALSLAPNVADGASSVALDINNGTTLTNTTAELLRLRNNGTEIASCIAGDSGVTGKLKLSSSLNGMATHLTFFNSTLATSSSIAMQTSIQWTLPSGNVFTILNNAQSATLLSLSTTTLSMPGTLDRAASGATTIGGAAGNSTAITVQGTTSVALKSPNSSGLVQTDDSSGTQMGYGNNSVMCNSTLCQSTASAGSASWGMYHPKGQSATPSISAGTGAGTSPTVSVTGNDMIGHLSITTGTAPSGSNATIATITAGVTAGWSTAPHCLVTPANNATQALAVGTQAFVDPANSTTAHWLLTSGATALTASTAYKWNYFCGE